MNTKDKQFIITNFDEIVIKPNSDIKLAEGEYAYPESKEGRLTNPNEIIALKQRQSADTMHNEMLGHYNPKTGKYEIADNIKTELKNVLKRIDNIIGDTMFVSSVSSFGGLGKLYFVVRTVAGNQKATSTLYVCEAVDRVLDTIENTEVHKVCEFEKHDRRFDNNNKLTWENYMQEMHDEFCILYSEKRAEEEPVQKNFFKGLILRQKLLQKTLSKNAITMVESLEANLLLARIEILAQLGPYGFSVLQTFEALKAQSKKFIKEGDLTAKDQNELLEEALAANKGKHDEKLQNEFYKKQLPAVKDYLDKVTEYKEVNTQPILENIDRRMPSIIEDVKKYDDRLRIEKLLKEQADFSKKTLAAATKPADIVLPEKKPLVAAELSKEALAKLNQKTTPVLANPEALAKAELLKKAMLEAGAKQQQTKDSKPEVKPVIQSELKQHQTRPKTQADIEREHQQALEKALAEKALLEQEQLKRKTPQRKASIEELQKKIKALIKKVPEPQTPAKNAGKVVPAAAGVIKDKGPLIKAVPKGGTPVSKQFTFGKVDGPMKFKEDKKGGGKKADDKRLDEKELRDAIADKADLRKDALAASVKVSAPPPAPVISAPITSSPIIPTEPTTEGKNFGNININKNANPGVSTLQRTKVKNL